MEQKEFLSLNYCNCDMKALKSLFIPALLFVLVILFFVSQYIDFLYQTVFGLSQVFAMR